MASTFTTSFRLDKQGIGDNKSTWGTIANRNFDLIEAAVVGYIDVPIANVDTNLAGADGAADTPRNFMLNFTGTLTANRTVTVPRASKTYIIRNGTTGTPSAFSIIFKCLSETLPAKQVTLRGGEVRFVYFDTALNAWTNESWVDRSTTTRRWSTTPYVDATGAMEIGNFIDFHNVDADATDFAVRLGSFNASGTASTTNLYITPAGGAASAAGLLWHSNNDGPASGLNADLLDNFHAADLAFPAGTRMLFMQATAPTGWTRDTDVTLNNRALRVMTSGVAGSGGTLDFTAAFNSSRATSGGDVGATILTTAQIPVHTHPIDADGRSGTEAAHTHPSGALTTGTENADHYHTMFAVGQGDATLTATSYVMTDSGAFGDWNYIMHRDSSPTVAATVGRTSGRVGAHIHDITGSTGAGTSHYHTIPINTGNAGSGGSHDHTFTNPAVNMDVKFVDAIIGIKA